MMQPFPKTIYKLTPHSIAIIEKAEFIKTNNPISLGRQSINYGINDGLKFESDGDKH